MQRVEFKTVEKFIRWTFLIFGIAVVSYGFYGTMTKFNQMKVLLQEELEIKEKFIFPSITFCSKFKHGGKETLLNYYPPLFEKWKEQGIKTYKINITHYLVVFLKIVCIK